MTKSAYKAPDGYLTLAEARIRIGVAKATITRMVQDGRLPTFDHPRDRRVRLVKVEDVERLSRASITLARAFQGWKARYKQNDEQLAEYLGTTVDVLPELGAALIPAEVTAGSRTL